MHHLRNIPGFLLFAAGAAAGPLRRYTNATVVAADCPSTIATTPTGNPGQPPTINGLTTLSPTFLSANDAPETTILASDDVEPSRSPLFSYDPLPETSPQPSTQDAASPTEDSTTPSTNLVTTTTLYTTAPRPQTTAGLNSTIPGTGNIVPTGGLTRTTTQPGQTYTPSPIPSPAETSERTSSTTTFTTTTSTAIFTTYITTSLEPTSPTTSPTLQTPNPPYRPTTSLPKIVPGEPGASTVTTNTSDMMKTTTSEVEGITIVPVHPSVIYLTTTVTDAGVTTTVGA